ncbi:hypothetical protein ACI3KS_09705 [Microbacterium sp. ZW T5_45]|uniref:hypothetical protein n=1 Tax=Microbacterium sp. ZW T5_45 TaxID=3378080 RepID=UPI003854B414
MPGPESTSPIRLDESPSDIVVHCEEHPWWTAMRFHRDEAFDAACGHEEREHPGDYRQRDARRSRAVRGVANATPPLSSEPGSRV